MDPINDFSNEEILISNLPEYEKVKMHKLQPKYLYVLLFNNAILFIVLAILFFIVTQIIDKKPIYIIYGVGTFLISIMVIYLILVKISFKNRGYTFRTHDIIYKEGIIQETTTIVPIKKIQHLVLEQSFLEKKMNLATLEIYTSGGSSSDLDLSGITLKDAQKYQEYISQMIISKEQIDQENE